MAERIQLPERYAKSYGVKQFDFSTTNWSATATVGTGSIVEQDTTNVQAGTSSLKVIKPDGESLVQVKQTTSFNFQTDGKDPTSITLWCYSNSMDNAKITCVFKSSGANYSFVHEGDYHYPTGWFAIKIPVASLTTSGTINWAALTEIVFNIAPISGATGATEIWLDSLYTDVKTKAAITVFFDDAFISDYIDAAIDTGDSTKGAFDKMYNQYGMVGSSAINVDAIDKSALFLSTANCQTMYDAGWEFTNQGFDDTPLASQSAPKEENLMTDLVACYDFLQTNGWTGSEGLVAYSGCDMSADLQVLLEADSRFEYGRRCSNGNAITGDATATAGHPNNKTLSPVNKWVHTGIIFSTANHTYTDLITYIDMLIETGSYGTMIMHKIQTGASSANNINDTEFGLVIDHLANAYQMGAIDVVTFRQYLENL